tara:strand:- start:82 stop:345 length:264 start_codon:yes stop_codon:yes gene_type:complete
MGFVSVLYNHKRAERWPCLEAANVRVLTTKSLRKLVPGYSRLATDNHLHKFEGHRKRLKVKAIPLVSLIKVTKVSKFRFVLPGIKLR